MLSNSSQIGEQIEVIQGVVLPVISKLNDSAPEKKPGNQTQFSPKKDSRKRKMNLTLSIIFVITATDGSCYRVVDWSFLKDFFHLSQHFCHAMKKKQLGKDKKRTNIVV